MSRHATLNRIYRLVWSAAHNTWVVVAEVARGRGKSSGRRKLLAPVCAVAFTLGSGLAQAGPTGGQVTAGSGSISQSGATTTIRQNSQNLSLNWQSFNVGKQETVNFVQPSASALAVNRIYDTAGSQIMGRLNANGQVWLINPNGVLFGQSAQVNVGGLVASTLELTASSADGQRATFSGSGTGSVINQGSLKAANGGYIALIGKNVANTGSISAPQGTAALGAGSAVTLNFNGNSLASLQVDQNLLDALAENGGLIQAEGGQVLLSAGARDSLITSVVNNTGVIEARTVEHRDGKIVLLAGMSAGTTNLAGRLDASAPDGGKGGFIETSGAKVTVADEAKVTTQAANGQTGTWLIDPTDFTVSAGSAPQTGSGIGASTLATNLGTNNVTLTTDNGSGSDAGDIHVNANVSWTSSNTLTLSAYRNINLNASISASAGTLKLHYGQGSTNGSGTGYALKGGPINLSAGNHFYTQQGSSGTETAWTVITSLGAEGSNTKTDLQGINGNLAGNYVLGSNIDAAATSGWNGGAGFMHIGNKPNPFTGRFDGLGHTIGGLTIKRAGALYVGLFSVTGSGSSIANVGLTGASVQGRDYVGGLAGFNTGTISNAYATGRVTGNNTVGGLVGHNDGTIGNAYAMGSVLGKDQAGGLAGGNGGTISNAYATGSVTGEESVGGLAGGNSGTISNAYATGSIVGERSVGGLVGWGAGHISEAYATGRVNGNYYVGGLAGTNSTSGKISNAYATGSVTGEDYVGGLAGGNGGSISNAYATGSVFGNSQVGGLVGWNTSNISNAYWDKTTSGTPTGVGKNSGNLNNVVGKTTAELAAALPTGFDSADWGNADKQTTPYLLSHGGFNTAGPVYLGSDTSFTPTAYGVIINVNQLQAINNKLSGNFVLGNNIDASATSGWNGGAGFAPIGSNAATSFTGHFDGLGHTIGGLSITRTSTDYVGLFGYTASGSSIANVGLTGVGVQGRRYVGGVAGENWGSINNAYATGSVSGSSLVGGLVGQNSGSGKISNAYATGGVSGIGEVGGLVGWNKGNISNAYAMGSVSSSGDLVGGLVGYNEGTTSNAYATGSVSGDGSVGGLVGKNFSGTISDAYATGSVSGYSEIGGLVGQNSNSGTISNAYATGSVSGDYVVGGLAGHNTATGKISKAYATGGVSGKGGVGGLVGWSEGYISNAYAMGSVTSSGDAVGGLVGHNDGATSNSYAAGSVSGKDHVGGLVGYNSTFGTISNAYWDTTTSGTPTGVGSNSGALTSVVGKTTAELAAALPTGFGSADWGNAGNQTTPYLLSHGGFDTAGPVYLGSDTSETPTAYGVIINVNQLQAINNKLSGNFVLGNNIDASATSGWNGGAGFDPIGEFGKTFNGSLDGLGHTINNLSINRTSMDFVGLFGFADDGSTIRNLGLLGGSVSGAAYVGGLAGRNDGTISNAYATGGVSGKSVVGGLVGYNLGTVSKAYATGSVSGNESVGGLVGLNSASGTISNAYATGSVSGSEYDVGGLAGVSGGTISNAYATGSVTGGVDVGGLVGSNWGTISNAYATSRVAGNRMVGGLVGHSDGTIGNAYAMGSVSGNDQVGGLAGYNSTFGTISNAYWDTTNSGTPTGVGDNIGSLNNVVGKTTAGLAAALPAGFDSAVWGNADKQTTPYLLSHGGFDTAGPVYLGSDTSATPTGHGVIINVNQLQAINNKLSGNFVLGNNIDASATSGWNGGAGFAPIGGAYLPFDGTFDGLGHTITALTINRPSADFVGLFMGTGSGGSVRNVGLENANVTGRNYVGPLVGSNAGTTENAYATGTVHGEQFVGGLVGANITGTLAHVHATSSVSAGMYAGGLVGANSSRLSDAYATGNVSANSAAGGLVGANGEGAITNAYATGRVTSVGSAGGLVGENTSGTINTAYATGDISGGDSVGGLVGLNRSHGAVSNAYATGSASGSAGVGGLIGYGYLSSVTNVYATGTAVGGRDVGGLVGINDLSAITNAYWNTTTSARSSATGYNSGELSNVFGLDTAAMHAAASFSAWGGDISNTGGSSAVWRIYEGATNPLLRHFLTPLTVTATSGTRTYDGTRAGLGVSYSTAPNANLLGVATALATGKNVGSQALTVSGLYSNQQGYDVSYVSGTLSITPAHLTGDITAAGKTYDGTTAATTAGSLAGVVAGDSVALTTIGAFSDKSAGTGKTVAVSGTLSGADAGNYTVSSNSTATADISAKAINGTISATSKTYDGTTAATTSGSLTGLIMGDTVALDTSGAFGDKNAGTGKTVAVSGVLSGADAGNYTVSSNTTAIADISAKAISSTISASGKTYDGTTAATTAGSLAGVVAGDAVALTTIGAFSDKNAGTGKTVAVTGTLSGADASNYTVSSNTTAIADISAKSISGTISADGKTYDGTTAATTSSTLAGLIAGDAVALTTAGTFSDKNAGIGKTVAVSGTLSGTDAGNYAVETNSATTADISAKAINGTISASGKTYDGTTAASTVGSVAGVVAGDSVALDTTGAFSDKNAGTGKTVAVSGALSGADAGNYTLSYNATTTADISAKAITGRISASGKTYDGTTTATTAGSLSGVVSGDAVVLNTTGTFSDKNTGIGKTVAVSGTLSGTDAGNYAVETNSATTADISAKAITGTIGASGKTYDGTTTATTAGSLAGVVAGDAVALTTAGTFSDKNAGTGKTVVVSGALSGADAGNYTVSHNTTTAADISAKAITGTIAAIGKTYDGTTAATTSGSIAGVLRGDTVALDTSGAFSDKNVGTGKTVTVSGTLSGVDAGNYTVSHNTTAIADISAKAISGTITATSKTYDGTTAATTSGSLTGLITGDTVALDTTGAFSDKNAGTSKTVVVSGALSGADAANYSLSHNSTTAADISAKAINGTISASGKTYDGTTVATTAGSLSGVVSGDAVALNTTGAFNDKNAGTGKTVAVSGVLSGADAGNYSVSHNATTTADIAQATLIYVAEPVSGFVGLPPSLSGTVTGFVSGDTQANATTGTMVWLSSGSTATEPGRYAVTGNGLSAANYAFAQAAGNATALTLQAGGLPPSVGSVSSQLDVSQLRSPSAPGTTIPTGRQTAPGTVLISTSAGPVLTLADASLDNVEQLLAMAPTAAGEASGDAEGRFAPSDEERAAQSANTILSLRVEDGGVRLPAGRVSFK